MRVDVVAQVVESDAGEMLGAAGKNHCQAEEGESENSFAQERALNSRGVCTGNKV